MENGGKVDLSLANDQITELPAAICRYLAGVFEVDLHDMVRTQLQLGADVIVPAGDIADIRIGHKVGGGDLLFQHLEFAEGVEIGGIHDLHTQHDACPFRHFGCRLHPVDEVAVGLVALRFVIDVVARQLDAANAELVRQIDRFFHDDGRLLADGRILRTKRKAAMGAQAHGVQR